MLVLLLRGCCPGLGELTAALPNFLLIPHSSRIGEIKLRDGNFSFDRVGRKRNEVAFFGDLPHLTSSRTSVGTAGGRELGWNSTGTAE